MATFGVSLPPSPRKRCRHRTVDPGGVVLLPAIQVPPPKVKSLPLTGTRPPASPNFRSHSSSPQRLPSIRQSRCSTVTPTAVSHYPSRCTTDTPVAASYTSHSPYGDISERSYTSSVALPAIDMSCVGLAKFVDIGAWVNEAAKVDALAQELHAKDVKIPDVRVTAMAYDVLSRLAHVLPAQRNVMESLLGLLHGHVYYAQGGSNIVTSLDAVFGRALNARKQKTSCEETDSEDSDSDSDSDADLDIDFCLKKMTHTEAISAHLLSAGDSTKRATSARKDAIVSQYAVPTESDIVQNILGLEPHEQLPEQFSKVAPYFAIVRWLHTLSKKWKDTVLWMHAIRDGVEGQQNACYRLLGTAMEFTGAILHYWCFSLWRECHITGSILVQQVDLARSFWSVDLKKMFFCWRTFANLSKYAKLDSELREREVEMTMLRSAEVHLDVTLAENSYRVDVSQRAIEHYSANLSLHARVRDDLQATLGFFSPEDLRLNFDRLLESYLPFLCSIAQLEWLRCKRWVFSRDLGFIFREDDVVRKAEVFSVEAIMVRWINQLLGGLKRQCSELIEMDSDDMVTDQHSGWSSNDAPQLTVWCRQVRAQAFVKNLGSDLRDGVVLTALYAMFKSRRSKSPVIDPADLWPLDGSPEEKNSTIIQCLNTFAPTCKVACMLKPIDIQSGNVHALTPFLASLFLHEVPGESPAQLLKRKPTRVQKVNAWLHHVHHPVTKTGKLERQQTRSSMTKSREDSDSSSSDEGSGNSTSSREDSADEEKLRLEHVFLMLESVAGPWTYNGCQDPSILLRDREVLSDLLRMQEQDLLLRWMNQQLRGSGEPRIANFGTSLKTGRQLLKIITKVLPELRRAACVSEPEPEEEEQHVIDALLELGPRCTSVFALGADEIQTGHQDLIASFVGKLFVSSPNLPPKVGTKLWNHRRLLAHITRRGFAVKDATNDPHHLEKLRRFCAQLTKKQAQVSSAVRDLSEAGKIMDGLRRRVEDFCQACYEARSRKSVVVMENSVHRTQSAPVRLENVMDCVKTSEWRRVVRNDPIDLFQDRIRKVVQSYASLLQLEFSKHSLPCVSGENRLSLTGLMRIFRNCRLRCPCAHLPPHIAESIYVHILEEDLPAWKRNQEQQAEGLSMRGFVRWILRVALHRHEMMQKANEIGHDVHVAATLDELLRRHVQPFCGHSDEDLDEFQRLSNDPEIQSVFSTREKELRAVFQAYSSEKRQRNNEEAVKEVVYHVMHVGEFEELLSDSGLAPSNGALTHDAIHQAFSHVLARAGLSEGGGHACEAIRDLEKQEQYQRKSSLLQAPQTADVKDTSSPSRLSLPRSSTSRAESKEATKKSKRNLKRSPFTSQEKSLKKTNEQVSTQSTGVADTSEPGISFYEFLDCLMAAALYVNPNPMVSPNMRVESVLTKSMIPGLIEFLRFSAEEEQRITIRQQRRSLLGLLSEAKEQEPPKMAKKRSSKRHSAKERAGSETGAKVVGQGTVGRKSIMKAMAMQEVLRGSHHGATESSDSLDKLSGISMARNSVP